MREPAKKKLTALRITADDTDERFSRKSRTRIQISGTLSQYLILRHMMHTVTLLLVSLFLISVSAKPAEPMCSSEGLTCKTDEEKCCDGLSCLVSGDDKVRRCFQLLPSVEYEEV